MDNIMKLTLDDWQSLRVVRDGDAIFVARPDFVNLQESPAVWYAPGDEHFDTLSEWLNVGTPLAHLPLIEVIDIIRRLIQQWSSHEN
jgi:hypothetical protein